MNCCIRTWDLRHSTSQWVKMLWVFQFSPNDSTTSDGTSSYMRRTPKMSWDKTFFHSVLLTKSRIIILSNVFHHFSSIRHESPVMSNVNKVPFQVIQSSFFYIKWISFWRLKKEIDKIFHSNSLLELGREKFVKFDKKFQFTGDLLLSGAYFSVWQNWNLIGKLNKILLKDLKAPSLFSLELNVNHLCAERICWWKNEKFVFRINKKIRAY